MNYESIVNGIKQNDNNAIVEFYNEFYKDVYYVCYKITENAQDAEDITQETLIRAINKIDLLTTPSGLPAWLRTIANNLSINYLKKNRKFAMVENSDEDEETDILDEQPSTLKNAEEIVADKEVSDILLAMIEKLPKEQRLTIFMFYYQEMTVREISEAMDCSEATVRSRINYAKKSLRIQVEQLEDKGVKLRCIALLPFLLTIYSFEKYAVGANISMPNILGNSSVSTGNITTNNVSQSNPQTTNPQIKGDIMTKANGTKMATGIKFGIGAAVAALAAVGIAAALILGGNDSAGSSSSSNKPGQTISSEELNGLEAVNTKPTYDLHFAGKWGDIDLGVSYLVPLQQKESYSYDIRHGSWLFYNGAVHQTNNGDLISVVYGPESFDKIDTMFTDCYQYINCNFGEVSDINYIEITSKKDVRIGDKKAVYYEGKVNKDNIVAGYVVDFNGKLINFNVFHCTAVDSTNLDESLEYTVQMILSLEEYDGGMTVDINDNADFDLSSIFHYSTEVTTDNHTYTVQHLWSNYKDYMYPYIVSGFSNCNTSMRLYAIEEESIVNATDYIQALYDYAKEDWSFNVENKKHDIVSSEKVTIAGIEMNKDVIVEYSTKYYTDPPTQATVMYSFVADGKFFVLFDTETIYTENYIERWSKDTIPTDEERAVAIDEAINEAEKIAGSIIRTLTVK